MRPGGRFVGGKVRCYKTLFELGDPHEPDSEPEAEADEGPRTVIIDQMIGQLKISSCPPDMLAASLPSACCYGEPGEEAETRSESGKTRAVEPAEQTTTRPPEPAASRPSAC